MAIQYIDLVNRLRDRFNEVRLDALSTWTTAVGFDQFTKDAINYAYRDIINAELEWPFSHISATLYTVPGQQLYNIVTGSNYTVPTGYLVELDTIDMDSFYIGHNQTVETWTNESHTIPSGSLPTLIVNNVNQASTITGTTKIYYLDQGITINSVAAIAVTGEPLTGQYSVRATDGTYAFSSADAGKTALITYKTVAQPPASFPTPISATWLQRIDYDLWRQNYMGVDLNPNSYNKPTNVFQTQTSGIVGFTPVPDKTYNIFLEFWLDATEMSNTTDIPLIPQHYWQVIIDGAQKYCYEFREDGQLAQMADARFKAGVERMRIELINTDKTMSAGFSWYSQGYSNPYYFA